MSRKSIGSLCPFIYVLFIGLIILGEKLRYGSSRVWQTSYSSFEWSNGEDEKKKRKKYENEKRKERLRIYTQEYLDVKEPFQFCVFTYKTSNWFVTGIVKISKSWTVKLSWHSKPKTQ